MIEELTVQNYALVDRLSIRFNEGLNVLSGETGAGKSILVGALSLLRGVKADTGSIRAGSDEAVVTGVFRIADNQAVLNWLREHGIQDEDGSLVIRRTIKTQGRGPIYVQNAPVTRADLEELGSLLFDIHGQHAHQSLLSEDNHRIFLDQYAELVPRVQAFTKRFQEIAGLRKRLEKLMSDERERLRQADILAFAVREIEDAALQPNEEDELEQERRILSQHEQLYAAVESVYNLLSENRGGTLLRMREARASIEQAVAIDAELSALSTRLDDAFYEIEDVAETIGEYRSTLSFSPGRLEAVEERLATIRKLEKKYGDTIPDILSYLEEARQELSDLSNWEEDKERLSTEIARGEQEVLAEARLISEARQTTAEELTHTIVESLGKLGMPKARFVIAVDRRKNDAGKPACGPYGLDAVSFRLSANPGEPVKQLRSIASGGEISRVMLALKSAFAATDEVSSLIFDEVDAGIGGEVALQVGEYLKALSTHKQILCITHLATIAVRADNHLRVEKRVRSERTSTDVRAVAGDDRIDEIARMLAGDTTGTASRSHAEDMLRTYSEERGTGVRR